MNKNELVSVIIPVYNSEKFLTECIESVLNQTYKDIEIIAVNDGSTDNSLKILQNYSDKITIISQENQGLASALNVGIDAMNGKWFKWFSPDDVMYLKTIETLVMSAKNQTQNTIVYSNWDIIDEYGKKLRSFSESNYSDLDSEEFIVRLLDGQQINVNTTLIPFELLNNLKLGNLNDPVLIDYDFFLRAALLKNTKFYLIEQSLIKYRMHQSQTSHKNIVESMKNLDSVKDDVLSKINKKTKNLYLEKLTLYRKKKSISKKSLEMGLKVMSSFLPNSATDKILVFYLNNLRSKR